MTNHVPAMPTIEKDFFRLISLRHFSWYLSLFIGPSLCPSVRSFARKWGEKPNDPQLVVVHPALLSTAYGYISGLVSWVNDLGKSKRLPQCELKEQNWIHLSSEGIDRNTKTKKIWQGKEEDGEEEVEEEEDEEEGRKKETRPTWSIVEISRIYMSLHEFTWI